MKETIGKINTYSYDFCKDCPMQVLELKTKKLYANGQPYDVENCMKCRFSDICLHLYEHLTESFEQDSEWNEDEDTHTHTHTHTHDMCMDSDDYSFCDDVSWEDRQI